MSNLTIGSKHRPILEGWGGRDLLYSLKILELEIDVHVCSGEIKLPFVVTRYALGSQPKVTITKSTYNSLREEKDFIMEYIFIEQKFDLLIENYIELENNLLAVATRHMVQSKYDYQYMVEQRLATTRLISNLLSSCRLFVDHTAHHLSVISKTRLDFVTKFNDLRHQKYDENIEYQTLEALRNYSQHRGFPVHTLTFGTKWDEVPSSDPKNKEKDLDNTLSFRVTPFLNVEELKNDKKFKTIVTKRLQDKGYKKIDLVLFIRTYVGLISEIHQEIRSHYDKEISGAQKSISDAIQKFERKAKQTVTVAVVAMSLDGRGIKREDPVFLSRDMLDYLDAIRRTNIGAKNLHRRYVTNKAS